MYEELLKQYPKLWYLRYVSNEWAPELPVDGGKPSRGTKADQRLTRNKPQTTQPKPTPMPVKKGR